LMRVQEPGGWSTRNRPLLRVLERAGILEVRLHRVLRARCGRQREARADAAEKGLQSGASRHAGFWLG
jgi:hypothetical protein